MRRRANILLFFIAALIAFLPADSGSTARHHSSKPHYVKGYVRKDGTYVHGYMTHGGVWSARTVPTRSSGYHAGTIVFHSTSASYSTLHGAHIRCFTCPRDSHGNIKRSQEAKREFRRSHPCPSTGRTTGPCPGYVIDHIKPLKRGGVDAPYNMQWQTKEAAKAKDKVE